LKGNNHQNETRKRREKILPMVTALDPSYYRQTESGYSNYGKHTTVRTFIQVPWPREGQGSAGSLAKNPLACSYMLVSWRLAGGLHMPSFPMADSLAHDAATIAGLLRACASITLLHKRTEGI
jgi:hypothetical protein